MNKPLISTSCLGCALWVGVLIWLATSHPRPLAIGILILFAVYVFYGMMRSLYLAFGGK